MRSLVSQQRLLIFKIEVRGKKTNEASFDRIFVAYHHKDLFRILSARDAREVCAALFLLPFWACGPDLMKMK